MTITGVWQFIPLTDLKKCLLFALFEQRISYQIENCMQVGNRLIYLITRVLASDGKTIAHQGTCHFICVFL